jgi:gluconolactonase
VEPGTSALPRIAEADEAVSVRSDLGKTEGPVWLGDAVACTSIDHGRLYVVGASGLAVVECPGGPNGMALGEHGAYVARNGGLWGASPSEPGIVLISATGSADLVRLPASSSPNDLAFGPDGRLWFTDTGREGNPHDPSVRAGQLWSCRPDGSDLRVELTDRPFCNGLAFSADGTWLYVTETAARHVLRIAWSPQGLGEPQVLAVLPTGLPDGIAVDDLGRLWLPASLGDCLLLLAPDGGWLGMLPTGAGSRPTNCCFGGADGADLFVTASGAQAVLNVRTAVRGTALRADGPTTSGSEALRSAAMRPPQAPRAGVEFRRARITETRGEHRRENSSQTEEQLQD